MARNHGVQPEILTAVDQVNNRQKHVLMEKINQHFRGNLQGVRFAIWGLAFKPKTDDIREAPALVLIESLLEKGATVCGVRSRSAGKRQARTGRPNQLR
jgi:UDPglucose 6-dehydrogenase